MKHGKISESILKRSVLKQIHTKDVRVIDGPAVGKDAALISVNEDLITVSSNPFILDTDDVKLSARLAVYRAINNTVSAGATPTGITATIIMPTTGSEAQLRELTKALGDTCKEANMSVLGGHTQVSRAVKNIVIDITAIGSYSCDREKFSQNILPGMDIVAAGFAGLEGTAILASCKKDELAQKFSAAFVDKAAAYVDDIVMSSEAASAVCAGATAIHDASQGGVFGALWDMAEASNCGLDIDLKKIPIKQETIEISEYFDINPYKLLSGGCLLIAGENGAAIVKEIENCGGHAAIIGAATDSNDRVLLMDGEKRFLETAQTDEIYKVFD